MEFQVPQFIEIEDKIIGPLTFKQFIYIAGGLGLAFILWVYLPHWLAIILIIPIVILALALAFYKINQRPFINVLESAFYYLSNHKLYLRGHESKGSPPVKSSVKATPRPGLTIPRLSNSRLKDLSWSLDVQEKIK